MDRSGLWVSLIMQIFVMGLAVRSFFSGMEEEETLKMVLSAAAAIILAVLAIITVKKLRELY